MQPKLAPTHDLVNPAMLVLARESRGLTQVELADRVNVPQAIISRYESGGRNVGEHDLQRIADVLGYPTAFFFQSSQAHGVGSSGVYHRKRKTLPARLLNRLTAQINIVRLVVEKLLRSVDIERTQRFPEYNVDEFNGNIERIAEYVRAAWKLPPGPIHDLIGAIENAGGIVYRTAFGTHLLDAIVQCIPPAPPIFMVNDAIPGDRLRFTLAHEIGHLVMHDIPRESMEEEADAFAAAFLMPANEIKHHFSRVTLAQLAQLKPYWKVSIAALIHRAHDLESITDRQYRSLNEEMSRLKYKTEEPVPIPIEKPTLLQEIIETHTKELGYSTAELAEMLLLNEAEFSRDYRLQPHLRLVPAPATVNPQRMCQ